jgi:putative transposase
MISSIISCGAPKYRRLALKGNIGKYVQRVIWEVAERYDFTVLKVAVMPDHVHLFISVLPDVSPAALLQKKIKSITAREAFRRFAGLKRLLWGSEVTSR